MADSKLSALATAAAVDWLYGEVGGASKKIAPANVGGLVLIDSGTITDPVEFLDITLPSGYFVFQLVISGLLLPNDTPCFAFSTNAGVNFVNGDDSYLTNELDILNNASVSNFLDFSLGVFGLDSQSNETAGALITSWIDPGSASLSFRVKYHASKWYAPNSNLIENIGSCIFNPAATVPITLARANLIRLLPQGNGDCDPPTSGETITAGSWTLFGIPSP